MVHGEETVGLDYELTSPQPNSPHRSFTVERLRVCLEDAWAACNNLHVFSMAS